ncbi:hypothetical protein J4E91_008772 [Alternaria rosae]|nr:hypothetical protein J4E91_008772 [Alternaria rosae]
MDALPGAVVQAFAHLWGQYPEVVAGIYAAGAIAAAVPNYMPSFEQAKVWYQKPRQSTRSVAKPAHTTEDAADIVKSIFTKARRPVLITITSSVSPACNTLLTVEQQVKVKVLDTSSSSESTQDTSESATECSARSSSEINDYSFETITIPLRSKTVSSAPPSSTGSGDSGPKEHKSAFTHYRQKAAGTSLQDPPVFKIPSGVPLFSTQNRASTLREHEPAFTDYTQQAPSKPVRDSPPSVKSQRSLWKDFRRAIHEEYVTQQADQKPTKPSYYTSPITMVDVMVGYVPSVLFTICDHLYKDDPDLQEMVGFMVRNAYVFVVGYLTYAKFRLPTLPYSEPVAYARSIGSVSYNVWQKAVADLLGKQQTDHFIIDRALYATLIGIAIYFLLFAGRRTREVVHHEQDESDLSEDEDMCETQDLPLCAPAVIPHQKETFIRSCIGFTVVMTVIWLSVYVQDLAVIFVCALAVYFLSIYGKEARKIIFTILNLVVGGFYRSVIAARNWIRYYAVVAVVVYLFTHEERLSLCAGRIFGGVTPSFSHFVVVLKLVGLSYVDLLVRGIIDVSRICIAKLRVVKAWAQYKFMLIVRGRAVFPVLSSFAFATTFMMMYVLGTNGVLACTQDYGVIFVTILVILLLLSHWRPGPIRAQNTPDEPLLKLPDEVVAPGSAPPSPPSAQIPAPTSGIGESEQRNPLSGGPGTINQPPDAQPAQAPQPPSDSQAVDLLNEDLSWLPDEVDALRTQQQASPVQAPVRTPTLEQSTEPPAQAQIEPQTPTADAWTQTDAPLSWPQRWMSWLFDSQVARTARGKTLEIARAAAEQEHKDFLEQCGLASGVEHEKKLKDTNAETKEIQSPNEDSASPAADSSMTFQPIGTEQQHRATVEAEKPEEAMPVIPSETATEAISGSTAQVPAIPVVAADTSASVRTLTPAATFKRTPLFAPALITTTPATTASLPPVAPATPTPPATTTPSSIATPAIPAISSGSLTVPTPVTTPTDIPKSAANTTEPSATLDSTFDLPTIVNNLPEPETQGEYTPMTYIPIEVTELAIPAKYTALTSDAYRETEHTPLVSSSPSISGSRFQDVEPSLGYKSSQDKRELTDKLANLGGQNATNAPDHQAPAAGLVQDQRDDDGQYHEHDGVHESDEEEEQDESEEEFDYGGASPTMGTSAPLQPASPVNAEIAAALQRYRDELQREAEQKKAMTSMNVASDEAPAPGDGDDNNRDNGDAKDHDDADNTPIPGAQTHDTPKPKKEPSSPTDVSMGGIDDDVPEATPTAKANPTVTGLLSHPAPSTTKPRPWAPFSSLPSYRDEPLMFTEDELSSQFALPAIYNRPAARPTYPTHPDSAEQWRNRLLGGPSILTVMRREREAAARRASGDGSDPPHGPGGPFGGNGGGGNGGGGGGANPPSPSGSAGSGPMEGVDESASSDEEHHGESDPHSHNNDDGQTTNNRAHTDDQTDNANNGNESDRDNDGDPSAQPGASNLADIPITTPSTLDATVTTDDDGDVDMSDLFNVDLDYIANAGFDDQQTPSTTTDDIWRQLVPAEGLEQHGGIPTSLDLFFEDTEYGEIATQNIFADIDAYEAQNGPIKTSDPMFEPPQYPANGESLDDLLGNAGDEYSLPNLQPSIIVPGPPNDARDAFDPFSDANWGAEFGDATQAEQDDDVSYQGFIRAATANAFGEDQEPARHDLAPPPPTHGDHFKLENYGVIEGHEELPAGLANFDLNSNQTGNNAKAQFPPKSGAQRIWDSDFNKAADNAEHEYKHPDEFTNVRPRTRLVQLWEDYKIVENPEHAEYRPAGMKSLDELTGRQGQVFRGVPVDTYEMRGESHDDYKDAQELMSWFDPDAEGAEPRGDPSPAGSDDGSALSDEINEDRLNTLANEVAKDQLNELNKAIKRAARDVSDDSDSEAPQKTPDGPATSQKESSGPRAGTQKKGRFQGPVSFDTEEEARFEKNDVEKVMELPIWQKLREAKATSTIPSPVQPSPVANPGLPTRPPTQSTLPTPSMPSSNPTSPSSHYRPPRPSQTYAKLPGSPLPYNPAIPGGFSLGGYQRSYNPATLHKMNGIPSFGKPITPHGQSGNAISPTRKAGYQSMKLPDAGSSNSGNSPMLSPACHPTQPTAGTATRNPPITLPAYNPMWAPVGMTSSNSSTTTPSYDPTQPAAGYTARSASSVRPQLLPIPGLSIPQMSLPQLSAITQQGRPAAQDEDAAGDQTSQTPGDDNKNDYSSDVDSIDGHHEKKPQEYYQQQQWGNAAQTSASASEAPPAAVNNEPVLDDEDANMGGCSPPMDKDSPS